MMCVQPLDTSDGADVGRHNSGAGAAVSTGGSWVVRSMSPSWSGAIRIIRQNKETARVQGSAGASVAACAASAMPIAGAAANIRSVGYHRNIVCPPIRMQFDVGRCSGQLRSPAAPVMFAAGGEIEVPVLPIHRTVVPAEGPIAPWAWSQHPIMAAGSAHVSVAGAVDPQPGVVVCQQLDVDIGSCHFQRPSCGMPHILRCPPRPFCVMPAVTVPLSVVADGVRKPDSEPV